MINHTPVRAVAALVLSSVFVSTAYANPDEVPASAVEGCRYLSGVTGSSGYGKSVGWQGRAKVSAEQKAARLGATHIVFTEVRPVGGFNGEVSGQAYTCLF